MGTRSMSRTPIVTMLPARVLLLYIEFHIPHSLFLESSASAVEKTLEACKIHILRNNVNIVKVEISPILIH